ncbi:coxsackievirus and adenovirus receptor homolog [Pelmatolapia mariae]|uniref:coxsackievirus and adenovirus receptor homolog n=1 Tax=Pelmatolapia mariae TaxID=158779 RepID=UPI002FE571F5
MWKEAGQAQQEASSREKEVWQSKGARKEGGLWRGATLDWSLRDHRNITSGQKNVTLTCRAPNNNTIIIVEWSRADLGDKYVLLYRNERFDPDNQHPSFKNRVDLQDRQMKDGDVSLILKNVTINDTGTYECRVKNELDSMKLINSIDLIVVPPDQKIIPAESGQKSISLPCRAPNSNIRVVEWSRADLGEKYVFVYRDGQFVPDDQHPSFKNRVDLQDRQMKDGDVSLILKDVTTADSGMYKCRVLMEETGSWEHSSIYLNVDPPGE